MKAFVPSSSAALFVGLLLLLGTGRTRATDIPAAINYQGRLTDNLGNPIATGYYEVQFKIWDDPTQSGAGDYIWGRSFAVHVVTNGLFNVLLSDAGGAVGTPQTGSLLSAFAGPNRFLGLTITMANGTAVPSPEEISPRQQLVSTPFAVQAQTANQVGPNAVDNSALAGASVTTAKLAAGAVTASIMAPNAVTSGAIAAGAVTAGALAANSVTSTALAANSVTASALAANSVTASTLAPNSVTAPALASNSVTSAAITNGSVTSVKLKIDQSFQLNDQTIYLRSTGDHNHGIGWYGTSTNLFNGVNVDGPVVFGYAGGALGTAQSGKQNLALTWKPNGYVGIGTTNPQAPLHVTGSFSSAHATNNGYYLKYANGSSIKSLTDAGAIVGYFQGDLVADLGLISMQVASWSDARAKNILGISSGAEDLRKLEQIQITDYRWIDESQDSRQHKKVIAQQVEQVLPEAVSHMRKVIPNVYAKAVGLAYDAARQRLTLTLDKTHGFQVGDKVNVSTDQGDLVQVEVLEILSPKTFTVACDKKPEGAFVYGKWVDDYRMVDYDAIAMLNVSATQELHRQLKEKDAEIRRLQAQVEALAAREEEMALRFAKLESSVTTSKAPIQKASLR